MKILIVEDEKGLREALIRTLTGEGYLADGAGDKKPVIRSSICTGEKVACFKDLRTGALEEIMLIRNDADLEEFRKRYGIDGDIETVY